MKITAIFLTAAAILFSSCTKNDPAKVTEKETSAKVVFLVGDVQMVKNGTQSSVVLDMNVEKGSSIITAKKAECNLLIGSDSYLLVKENSKLLIESLALSPVGEKNSVELLGGKIVVNPKKLLKGDEFSVKTPTAIAAVRGTKFVVSNSAGESVKVSVVEGKVEMKPRIASVETSGGSAVVEEIKRKLDDRAVVIEANQTGVIQNAEAEKLNREIESVIKKSAETSADTSNKGQDAKNPEIKIAIDNAVKKIETVEVKKEQNISKIIKDDVSEHQSIIDLDRKKRELESKPSGMLTVNAPVNDAVITVNGKTAGRGSVSIKVEADIPLKINIAAKGFEPYTDEITLSKDEKRTLEASLIRAKLLSRLDWAVKAGNVKGDLVFYNDMVIAASSSGTVTAMNRSGAQIWKYNIGAGIDSSPAVSGGKLYIVGMNETIHAIDATTGKLIWNAKTGGTLSFGAAPRVAEGNIVTALSNGKIKAFSADGKELWTSDISAGIYSTPASSSGMIFVGADDQILYAVNLKDGDIEWKAKLDGRVVSSSPAVYDGKIIVGTFKGTLVGINMKKGKIDWTFKTGGSIVSAPVLRDSKLYIGSKDQKVYAIDASNGKEVWSYKTGSPVSAEVSFNDQQMFVLSGKTVYAFNNKDGSLQWTHVLQEAGNSIIADNREVYVGTTGGLSGLRIDLREIVTK